jgi:hypothetical protein
LFSLPIVVDRPMLYCAPSSKYRHSERLSTDLSGDTEP